MAHDLKFILFNRDEEYALELRAQLQKQGTVKIVAEVDEPALLGQAVAQFNPDVLVANLDPDPAFILPLVGETAAAHPHVAVFAVSQSTEGSLILKAMRLGIKEFFPRPIDPAMLEEAVGKIATQRKDSANHGKLITVTGTSGGVGATTIATNLAVELGQLAAGKVTAVDLDFRFGQVATFLDVDPKYTLADLCQSTEQLEAATLTRALTHHHSGINVLSRPLHFAEADAITAAACVGVLSSLLQMNEYVVTDGPTRFDQSAHSVFALSDVNIIVVQLVVPSVRNALRIVEAMRQSGYNLDRTRLMCNRAGREAGHLSVQNVSETLGLDVFASIPDDWETVSGAINLGEPLLTHSPKNKVRQSIQEIAARFHRPLADADDKEPKKKNLIGRIFANS
jgi:pilus assembly protein CpaE